MGMGMAGEEEEIAAVDAAPAEPFIASLAYSVDGQGDVARSDGGFASLPLSGMARHLGVNCLAFTPDGGVLAAGGDDGCVTLWDVAHAADAAKNGAEGGGGSTAVRSLALLSTMSAPAVTSGRWTEYASTRGGDAAALKEMLSEVPGKPDAGLASELPDDGWPSLTPQLFGDATCSLLTPFYAPSAVRARPPAARRRFPCRPARARAFGRCETAPARVPSSSCIIMTTPSRVLPYRHATRDRAGPRARYGYDLTRSITRPRDDDR